MKFSTPEATESAFYAAFEARSLDAMMAVCNGNRGPLLLPEKGEYDERTKNDVPYTSVCNFAGYLDDRN